jgi:CRP/FNR family cyclic AMP-dependent transcriptional regulator
VSELGGIAHDGIAAVAAARGASTSRGADAQRNAAGVSKPAVACALRARILYPMPATETLKQFLIGTPFFGGLDDAALELLVGMLTERRFERGEVVFREGDTGASMYVIECGEIVLCRTGDSGLEVHIVRLRAGDFFGETTLIEMQPRPYLAQVDADARLYELTNRDLYRLYKANVEAYVMVVQNINRELCRRLRRADLRITEFADRDGDPQTQVHIRVMKPTARR